MMTRTLTFKTTGATHEQCKWTAVQVAAMYFDLPPVDFDLEHVDGEVNEIETSLDGGVSVASFTTHWRAVADR